MDRPGWWDVETLFVTSVGALMAVMLAGFVFSRPQPRTAGSALVPARTLERILEHERRCQTIDDARHAQRC